jgi:hypothetical protein
MKIAAYTVLLLLLIACNSSSDTKTPKDLPVDTNATTQPATIETDTIQPVKLAKEQLPAEIKFKGTMHEAWQWKDRTGDNLLITSLVPPYMDKQKNEYGEEGGSSELYAFHFVKNDTGYSLLWKISDAEKACPFDLTVGFFKDAVTITDLDKDGTAETTVQYRKACRSDVSPAYMKLVMHEDTTKYSLRGGMWVFDGGNGKFEVTEKDVNLEKLTKPKDEMAKMHQLYGRYETEKEFANAPPEFLIHARNQWLKYAKESFD